MTKKKYEYKEGNSIAKIIFKTTNKDFLEKVKKAFNEACDQIIFEKISEANQLD